MSDAPSVVGHTFVHSPEGWVCERCNRRWCNVVARQPSWPAHDRSLGIDPLGEGIACVGDLNDREQGQIDAEVQRVWAALLDAAGRGYKTTAEPEE